MTQMPLRPSGKDRFHDAFVDEVGGPALRVQLHAGLLPRTAQVGGLRPSALERFADALIEYGAHPALVRAVAV
jgi:hypothetical protein